MQGQTTGEAPTKGLTPNALRACEGGSRSLLLVGGEGCGYGATVGRTGRALIPGRLPAAASRLRLAARLPASRLARGSTSRRVRRARSGGSARGARGRKRRDTPR